MAMERHNMSSWDDRVPKLVCFCFPTHCHLLQSIAFLPSKQAYHCWLADRRVDIIRYESLPAISGFTLKLLSMQFFRGAPTGQRWQLFQDGTMNHARVDASLTSWTGNLQKHSS